MLRTREDVSAIIQKECKKYLLKPSEQRKFITKLNTKYAIPYDMASDIISMRTRPEDYSDFVMFAMLDIILPSKLDELFTSSEIETYLVAKFEQKKIKLPLKWKMAEITEGQQWIGAIKLSELMALRSGSWIRYNEDTQRTMKRIISGDTCYYEITLDRKAVNSIKNAIESDQYIPTTLTFNLPEDAEFYYKDGELVIQKCDYLDIVDGYHRYIALSKVYDLNPKFDFNMELRITSFSESRAKQFIWQEDQKTKMRKIDSESLNQTNPAVKIVQQLNTDANFILAGKMNRTNGIINISDFTAIIEDLFYSTNKRRTLNKGNEIQYQQFVKKQLLEGINKVVENNVEYTTKPWSYERLLLVCLSILNNTESNYDTIVETKVGELIVEHIPANKKISQRQLTGMMETINKYFAKESR